MADEMYRNVLKAETPTPKRRDPHMSFWISLTRDRLNTRHYVGYVKTRNSRVY